MQIRTVITIETEDKDGDPVEKIEELLHTIATNGESIADYAEICHRNNENEEWKNILGGYKRCSE